jgi:hypothetical protein
MRRRTARLTQVCVSFILIVSALDAGDGPERIPSAEAFPARALDARTAPRLTLPWIHPSMPLSIRKKLENSYKLAAERIVEMPECRSLFTALGADAFEILKTGLYFPADPAKETSVCRRTMAQTYVGGAPTWICRRVTSYPDETVAIVLIHEALHHAGLAEDKNDRTAMSSASIDRKVRKSCGL